MQNLILITATVSDAESVFTTIIDGLAPSVLTLAALGLAVWIGPYSVSLLVSAFAQSSDESWRDMVSDPDSMYHNDDGSICDRETGEVVFESRSGEESRDEDELPDGWIRDHNGDPVESLAAKWAREEREESEKFRPNK